MNDPSSRFWEVLDDLVATSIIKIDRPAGSAHPRFPQFVYPVDYGYLDDTRGGDGEGIDLWRGTADTRKVVAAAATADPFKRDAELKILYACTPEETSAIEAFYQHQPQGAVLFHRDGPRLP